MSGKKRVVFFIGALVAGGAERVVSILTHQFASIGVPTELVLFRDIPSFYETHPDVRVTCVEQETGSRNIIKNMLWLRRYFRKNADCVISFLAQYNMVALVTAMGTGIPVVVADRNDPRHMPKQAPVRVVRNLLYHLADTVVVQTQHNKTYFPKMLQRKCKIIYNPVDLGEKRELALRTEKKHRIVSVARLMKQKNQIMLIDAFAQVKEDFPDYTLTIYGEGPFRDDLQNRIDALELSDSVELPGKTQNVFDHIADADLFVLSSDFEGMPNALIEAMCLGLPVISTEVSGATDLIEDGINGLLTEVGNPQALADNMKRILKNAQLRRNCAQEAIQLNDLLRTDCIVKQWQDCIKL